MPCEVVRDSRGEGREREQLQAESGDVGLLKGMEPPLRAEEEHLVGTVGDCIRMAPYTIATGKVRVLDLVYANLADRSTCGGR